VRDRFPPCSIGAGSSGGAAVEGEDAVADAKLTKVSIRFTTHNDNKDHDTRLDVTVKNRVSMFLSETLAEGQSIGGDMEFVDPSTHEFDLVLSSNNVTIRDLTLPVVNIHIQPSGHDRWIFDYKVSLVFEDGKTFSSTKNGIVLDQDNKDYTGVFEA
jgi:hypothetical protein